VGYSAKRAHVEGERAPLLLLTSIHTSEEQRPGSRLLASSALRSGQVGSCFCSPTLSTTGTGSVRSLEGPWLLGSRDGHHHVRGGLGIGGSEPAPTLSRKGRQRSCRQWWDQQGPAHCHQPKKIQHHICNSVKKSILCFECYKF